ncbi:MAG: tRNA (guanosine(37)-N1)-methyltransferase TrmD [Gammaproteobacteria bacterium]|nr:tRNA (guanosine(37)-N1)-methyltransferase TrmD [Gammaproteobacteria bacterium]NND59118.1 tRNA (guanosine(37)-N1)-methyltransferase TrmD [Gammaproteobacteria bacterium]
MHIEVVTLFPEMISAWTGYGVAGRAADNGLLQVNCINPRDYTEDSHRTVDDRPYGGGPGMVMKVAPLRKAIQAARNNVPAGSKVIALTPQGQRLDQSLAQALAAAPGMVLVCGRYEGIDERVLDSDIDLEVSIGDYVISGGELAAMTLADAVARLLPGVLGDDESAINDSFVDGLLDCPHFTRPEVIDGQAVPEVLLSGDHAAIRRWRLKQALGRTWLRRPELVRAAELNEEQQGLLQEFIAETGVSRRTENE